MSPKTYFILTVISCSLFGFAFLIHPSFIAHLHGSDQIDGYTLLMMRLYGGSLVSIAVMAWSALNAGPSLARKSIFLFLAVVVMFNTILNLIFINEFGPKLINWLELVVTILFGIGAFYFWKKEKLD